MSMRIITVNLPLEHHKSINHLTNNANGVYPSRSELIRIAIRDYLKCKLHATKSFVQKKEELLETSEIKTITKDGQEFIILADGTTYCVK